MLTQVGQMAPAFEIITIDGKPFRLESFRGRVVLVSFFATWCGPCRQELPHLERLWQDFGKEGLVMIVVGRDESEAELRAFRDKQGFSFPMGADSDGSIFGKYASGGIPRTYLVGGNGTILYQTAGYYESEMQKLRTMVRNALRQ